MVEFTLGKYYSQHGSREEIYSQGNSQPKNHTPIAEDQLVTGLAHTTYQVICFIVPPVWNNVGPCFSLKSLSKGCRPAVLGIVPHVG